jgi:hypothetical protein
VGESNRIALELSSRWMNQEGTLGFSPSISQTIPDEIFVTNPISARPRVPSADRALLPFSGGFLLHTGLPNAGWKSIRRRYSSHWAQSISPVWVHLISQDLDELNGMVRDCEEMEGIAAVELGLPPLCSRDWMLQLISAAAGELPLVLHTSLGEDPNLLNPLPDEVAAVTLGSPRGSLPMAGGKIIHGRLHGPGLFPQMLQGLINIKELDRPIILGGICNLQDAKTTLKNGAAAVQIDHFCWNDTLPDKAGQ